MPLHTAVTHTTAILQCTPVCCHELSKYYIVIRVLTSESARSIIIRIAVGPRTDPLEVLCRRAALAHIWIVGSTTTTVIISVVGQTRALAGYHVSAIPDFQIIRTSRVKISGATSRGAGVSTSTSNSCCHLKGNIMTCMIFGFKNLFYIDMTVCCHVTPCSLVDMYRTTVVNSKKTSGTCLIGK